MYLYVSVCILSISCIWNFLFLHLCTSFNCMYVHVSTCFYLKFTAVLDAEAGDNYFTVTIASLCGYPCTMCRNMCMVLVWAFPCFLNHASIWKCTSRLQNMFKHACPLAWKQWRQVIQVQVQNKAGITSTGHSRIVTGIWPYCAPHVDVVQLAARPLASPPRASKSLLHIRP